SQHSISLQVPILRRRICCAFPSQPSRHFPKSSSTLEIVESLVSSLIGAIASCTSISHCTSLHCRVIKSVNYNHGFIGDQLVSAYLRLGCSNDAETLFDELPDKDLISWNSLVSGFSRRGDLNNCLNAFSRLRYEMVIQPNEVTLIPVISACADNGDIDVGMCIHGFALKLGLLLEGVAEGKESCQKSWMQFH
ncbi:hypothetical protein Tsubulata_051491, partial [Turnera subulata]